MAKKKKQIKIKEIELPDAEKVTTIRNVLKQNELWQFIEWIILPEALREPKSQEKLARKLKVNNGTLSDWKTYEGFWEAVEAKRQLWGKEKTNNVIKAFYDKILDNPTAADIQLWFTIFNDFKEVKSVELEDKRDVTDKFDGILNMLMIEDDSEQEDTPPTDSDVVSE